MDCPTAAPSFERRRSRPSWPLGGVGCTTRSSRRAPTDAALEQLLAAPEPRELTVGSSDASLLRLPWELMADAAGKLALRVALRRQV
jgi:hypothetical protein